LLEKGYQLYELSSPREVPPEDKIGYLFADELSKLGGETNMMSWVHNKIVASAAFSNLDWDRQVPQQIKNNLNIFYQSRSVPRAIMVAAPNLNPDLKEELKKILLTAHESAEGKRALYAYKRTEKFDEITPEILHTLEWVGALRVLIETNLLF
jgi:phosphonate transport system substrate-binding protein